MMSKPLIVTRPAGDAERLVAALEANGLSTICAPLMDIVFQPDAEVPDLAYQAILMTSANSCRALSRFDAAERLRDVLTIAVGETSAAAAREAGQTNVVVAGGDVDALVETAMAECRADGGPLLYVSGAVTTGRLGERLADHGFDVRRVVAYEAVAAEALPAPAAEAVAGHNAAGVILYSPRTAVIWCNLLNQAKLADRGRPLTYYCLSVNVADVIREAFGAEAVIVTAKSPNERAMIAAICDADQA